jgi:hypothetical protein
MTQVAQLYAPASQQIINLQGPNDLVETACDAVVRRLFSVSGASPESSRKNAIPLKRYLPIPTYA